MPIKYPMMSDPKNTAQNFFMSDKSPIPFDSLDTIDVLLIVFN